LIWPFNKKKANPQVKLALQPAGEQLVLLAVSASGGVISEHISLVDGLPDESQLEDVIERHNLRGAEARILAGLSDYQMLLVEAPPVEPSELAEAIKWKVKDLLSQPVEQSVVDGFLLPEDAFRGRQKMAYAVATQRTGLQALVSCLEEAGLGIREVTIAELSLLPAFATLDEHPALVLIVGQKGGFIAMIADQSVYLVRQLDITWADLESGGETSAAFEKLVLEIQRSRDYFESQMGKGVINRVIALPTLIEQSGIAGALKQQLGLPVEELSVVQVTDEALSLDQSLPVAAAEQQLLAAWLHAA